MYAIDYICDKCEQPAFDEDPEQLELYTTWTLNPCDRCGNTTWTVTAVEEVRAQ